MRREVRGAPVVDALTTRTRARRGAAVLELALITPLLVLAIVAGQVMTELLQVRLELREAARFAAWQVTGDSTFDHEAAAPAYEDATRRAGAAAAGRYARLDGLGDRLALLHVRTARSIAVEVSESELPFEGRAQGTLAADEGSEAAALAVRVQRSPQDALSAFGFTPRGLVRATASTSVEWNPFVEHAARDPDVDARGTTRRPAESVALIAGEWHVDDGRDVVATEAASGVHPDGARSQLWRAVDRGKWLGGEDPTATAARSALGVLGLLPVAPPDVDGTFVVALRAGQPVSDGRCPDLPNFPRHGLSAVADLRPLLDDPAAACFSTQPLRDTHEYAASLPLQALAARGAFFLGCVRAEADDPSRDLDEDGSDASTAKVQCGGAP